MQGDRTTVGRLVRVLKQIEDEHGGGPRFTIDSDGGVFFSAWDSESEQEVRKHFPDPIQAVEFYENVLIEERTR